MRLQLRTRASGHFAAALPGPASGRAGGAALGPPRVARRRALCPQLRNAIPSSSSPDPAISSSSDSDSEDPGRRVAMAMASSWGGRGGLGAASSPSASPSAASPPHHHHHRPRSRLSALLQTKNSPATTATTPTTTATATADLSRAIAASARAAALSSQLRAAHDALSPPLTPTPTTAQGDALSSPLTTTTAQALLAPISALAEAAAATDTDALTAGARTGNCEFFAYVLPSSPFLPAWREAVRSALPSLSRRQLAEALFALGRLPYYAPAPLPIGFGTPRYSRPLAAAEPEEWEALLNEAAEAWLRLEPATEDDANAKDEARFLLGLALSRRWAGERVGDAWLASREAEEALGKALAELPPAESPLSSSSSSLSPAARLAAALLQVRGAPPAPYTRALFEETAAPPPEGKPWPASWRADRRPSSLGAMISSAAADAAAAAAAEAEEEKGEEDADAPSSSSSSLSSRLERWRARVRWQDGREQGPPDGATGQSLPPPPPSPAAGGAPAAASTGNADEGDDDGSKKEEGDQTPPPLSTQQPSLASTLLHAQPPAPPASPPSALCSELSPKQVQRLARGLVYLGVVPPDPWLSALASAARCALGGGAALSRAELGALRDALKFFLSERRGEEGYCRGSGGPWRRAASGGRGEDRTGLADAVSLLDEWRVGGSGAF